MSMINRSEGAIYIGCALTQAPENFKAGVEDLRATLKTRYEILDFIGLEGGTAEDVYRWDIEHCIGSCSAMLAIVDHPSLGLGWEMGVASQNQTPTFAVAHEASKITRLVLGASEALDTFSFQTYSSLEEVPEMFEAFLHPQTV